MVVPEVGLEGVENERAVGFLFHIDKVDNDDAADIPQAQLLGNLLCSLAVDRRNGLFEVVLANELAGVDVYGGQRFRAVDNHIPAALEPDFSRQRFFNLRFRFVAVKERFAGP